MEWLFETKDRNGVVVRMSRETYERHLPTRPEMADYVAEAKLTVEDPHVIIVDHRGCYHHFRLGVGRGKFRKCYVQVLVHYRRRLGQKRGIVATYWLSRKLCEGETIWMRMPQDSTAC